MTCFTWNIEGLKRNIHSLKHFISEYRPDRIFLSEPQIFTPDIHATMQTVHGEYSFHLNSEDFHQPDLALDYSKAKGGTLAMWKLSLDPFITVLPTSSASVLAIVLALPHQEISSHICIYLPTCGQENEFISALSCLDSCIGQISDKYVDPNIFIRGDANVNPKNATRTSVFDHLLLKHNLVRVDVPHPTYHHFLGQGLFDSPLDVLIHVKKQSVTEEIQTIVCKLQHPLIESHHDLIISTFSLPLCKKTHDEKNISAPRIINNRVKVVWTYEGIENYKIAICDNLARLRNTWCIPSSPASMSVLLSSTYSLLSTAACTTNKVILLVNHTQPNLVGIPMLWQPNLISSGSIEY